MKKTLFIITLLGSILFGSSKAVEPVQAQYVWTCRASSPAAFGLWRHPDADFAASRAMQECQARTPYGMYCVLNGCW